MPIKTDCPQLINLPVNGTGSAENDLETNLRYTVAALPDAI